MHPSGIWFLIIGLLLIIMALATSWVRRLPLTTAVMYLVVGIGLGPSGINLFRLDPSLHAPLIERLSEILVLLSIFTAGLKLRLPWNDPQWKLALSLGTISMLITIGLITLLAVFTLKMPLGAAVLLGGILAPTDAVLASDVQVRSLEDRDQVRFSLTAEAGFNDGTAFPFVLLGLGLLGLHEIGDFGWKWVIVDLIWAVGAGLGIGVILGTGVAKIVVYLRRHHREAILLDDFLALGLISLSYGTALLANAYGFLAVFTAGLALRRTERLLTGDKLPDKIQEIAKLGKQEEIATDPDKAPAYMAQAVLYFNEQLERIGEVGMVLLLGGMFSTRYGLREELFFIPALLFVIRPISAFIGLSKSKIPKAQRQLIAWFGIRGIGSIYYLTFALNHGLMGAVAVQITALTLTTVMTSIILHGISVTPLMKYYSAPEKDFGPKS